MTAKKAAKSSTVRKATRRATEAANKRGAVKEPKAARKQAPTKGLYGWITHTDIASADPAATKAWAQKVLGWTFMPAFPSPAGEYHLFTYSAKGGGGIRATARGEPPHSVPMVHVQDTRASFAAALAAGAEPVAPPEQVMPGVTIAMVRAPGGVLLGFSGP